MEATVAVIVPVVTASRALIFTAVAVPSLIFALILLNPEKLAPAANKSITPSTASIVPDIESEITVIVPVVTGSSLSSPRL